MIEGCDLSRAVFFFFSKGKSYGFEVGYIFYFSPQCCSKNRKQLTTGATARSYVKFMYIYMKIYRYGGLYYVIYVVVKYAVTSRKCWPGIIIWYESPTTPVRRRLVFFVLRGRPLILFYINIMLCPRHCHDPRSYKHFYKRKMVPEHNRFAQKTKTSDSMHASWIARDLSKL